MRKSKDPTKVKIGKLSRARGVRFEREVANWFRAAGFSAERVCEFDQGQGRDIEIRLPTGMPLPVGIQCKATKSASDLLRGLRECVSKNPGLPLYTCIHRSRRVTRIAVAARLPDDTLQISLVTWDSLLSLIRAGLEPTATPAGDSSPSPASTASPTDPTAYEAPAKTATQVSAESAAYPATPAIRRSKLLAKRRATRQAVRTLNRLREQKRDQSKAPAPQDHQPA